LPPAWCLLYFRLVQIQKIVQKIVEIRKSDSAEFRLNLRRFENSRNVNVPGQASARRRLERLERSKAIERLERLERLERTDPRDERSEAIERLERFERLRYFMARGIALFLERRFQLGKGAHKLLKPRLFCTFLFLNPSKKTHNACLTPLCIPASSKSVPNLSVIFERRQPRSGTLYIVVYADSAYAVGLLPARLNAVI
jgi:hypothetical protein